MVPIDMQHCAQLASMLAIILLLLHADKKPLAYWGVPLTLNTMLSILGTVSHMSLAFAVSECLAQEKWN